MALPVRPPSWPVVVRPEAQPARNDARVSAQKAFFEAALAGKVAPQTVQLDETVVPRPRAASAAPERDPGDKFPRPGSIVDIWV